MAVETRGKQVGGNKSSVDIVAQQAILVETILKEERYQKLFTNYSINPFKKSKNFVRCQDTSDPRHFGTMETGPKCPDTSAPVPNCLPAIRQIVTRALDVGVAAL